VAHTRNQRLKSSIYHLETAFPTPFSYLCRFLRGRLYEYNIATVSLRHSLIHPSSTIHQPSSINHHPSTIIHYPSTFNPPPPPFIHQSTPYTRCLATTSRHANFHLFNYPPQQISAASSLHRTNTSTSISPTYPPKTRSTYYAPVSQTALSSKSQTSRQAAYIQQNLAIRYPLSACSRPYPTRSSSHTPKYPYLHPIPALFLSSCRQPSSSPSS
jgi:hypothetical protein